MRSWSCLVEVKTGTNPLTKDQVEAYLDLAKEQHLDAVLTISNDITPAAGAHPVDIDRRKTKSVQLHHRSWAEVLSLAVMCRVHSGVSDADQGWILGELIRYLEHPKSGALDFQDMGQSWVPVREAVVAGTLRPTDRGIAEVVSRWEQLLRFAALRLERELGTGVHTVTSRKEVVDPTLRLQTLRTDLVQRSVLAGAIRIPSTVGDLSIEADLCAGRVTVSVEIVAPADGRSLTRVNWLLRQLQDAPDHVRVDSYAHMARTSMSELLKAVREDPSLLVGDPKGEIRRFRVAAMSQLGTKRGVGRGTFIDSILSAVDGFYAVVLQNVRPWAPKPPQMPKSGTAMEAAGVDVRLTPAEIDAIKTEDPSISVASDRTIAAEGAEDLLPLPAPGTRVELASPLVSWDEQLEDLADERQLIPADASPSP